MMKAGFLDSTFRKGLSVFLIHGRLNDLFIGPDLILRDWEGYLCAYLRSKGFGDIIFYSADGAYALDAASARSIMCPDVSLPPLRDADDAAPPAGGSASPGAEAAAPAASRPRVASLLRRSGGSPEPSGMAAAPAPSDAGNVSQAPSRAVYGRRSWTLQEFIPLMESRMSGPLSRPMAVIFTDIISTRLGDHPKLLHNLLVTLEHNRHGHMVFLCAPAENSNSILFNTLDRAQIAAKFVSGTADSPVFHHTSSLSIGLPDEDEIMNLLHRLQIAGVDGRRLTLLQDAGTLAGDILYCSRQSCSGTLRHIWTVLRDWMVRTDTPMLSSQVIHQLWNTKQLPKQDPLEAINRPGWEAVYDHLKTLQSSLTKRMETPPPLIPAADITVSRLCDPQKDDSKRPEVPCFLLLGNPGTGKTTIARLIGQWLKSIGVLRQGHLVEVDKRELSSIYHGGIEENVRSRLEQAQEGILFIDEASALTSKDGGMNHDGSGKQVVNALLSAMTDPRQRFCLIMACYTSARDDLLALNPGLKRRFGNNIITIEDYQPPLLMRIFCDTVAEQGCRLDPALLTPFKTCPSSSPLLAMFETIYSNRERSTFGNADVPVKLGKFAAGLTGDDQTVTQAHLCKWAGITPDHFICRNTMNDLQNILQDFDANIIGMSTVRTMLETLSRRIRNAQANNIPLESILSRPPLFVGNAGVGKTTVCKLLARMYNGLGLVSSGEPLFHSASEINSAEVNSAARTILQWVDKARDTGKLLVIDEAHQLASNVHRYEGFTALMAEITRTDKPPLFIALTSYPDRLSFLIGDDQGAPRRFDPVMLPDYDGNELMAILELQARRKDLTILPEAQEILLPRLCQLAQGKGAVRNGGCVEALLTHGFMSHPSLHDCLLSRMDAQNIPFNSPEAHIVTAADIPLDTLDALSTSVSAMSTTA